LLARSSIGTAHVSGTCDGQPGGCSGRGSGGDGGGDGSGDGGEGGGDDAGGGDEVGGQPVTGCGLGTEEGSAKLKTLQHLVGSCTSGSRKGTLACVSQPSS
jgi:hypothetical protein